MLRLSISPVYAMLSLAMVTGACATGDPERSDAAAPRADDAASPDSSSSDAGSPDAVAESPLDAGLPMDAACAPACEQRQCGDDGCGGACGVCEGDSICDEAAGQCLANICPPGGPFGVRAGADAPDLELLDCDGVAHRIHDLCLARASYFFIFAGW